MTRAHWIYAVSLFAVLFVAFNVMAGAVRQKHSAKRYGYNYRSKYQRTHNATEILNPPKRYCTLFVASFSDGGDQAAGQNWINWNLDCRPEADAQPCFYTLKGWLWRWRDDTNSWALFSPFPQYTNDSAVGCNATKSGTWLLNTAGLCTPGVTLGMSLDVYQYTNQGYRLVDTGFHSFLCNP